MSIVGKILGGGFEKVVGSIGTVIDSLHTSKEEKALLENAKLQLVLAAQQAERELTVKLEEAYLADAANLREQVKLEVQSADWYVRRARPSIVWIGVVIVGFNLIGVPLGRMIASFWRPDVVVEPMLLPTEFWWTWVTTALGYGAMRSFDKWSARGPVMDTER
jgi:hypothetical protein